MTATPDEILAKTDRIRCVHMNANISRRQCVINQLDPSSQCKNCPTGREARESFFRNGEQEAVTMAAMEDACVEAITKQTKRGRPKGSGKTIRAQTAPAATPKAPNHKKNKIEILFRDFPEAYERLQALAKREHRSVPKQARYMLIQALEGADG